MSKSTSNLECLSDTSEITDLVKLLRQNGDKVLNASSKLSLSTTLLYNLNKAFSLIVDDAEDLGSSFQVCNSSKIDLFRDLKFLHDFVQKTISLKLTHHPDSTKVEININKFKRLKYLELRKVCIALVKGIQGIRGQLESIICVGRQGVTTVAQLLVTCGGDAGAGFIWASLRHLSLSHNALEQLDRSFELTPWLQILDLSHNLLISAAEIDCLPNLKYVNLGYNKLETAPNFHKSAAHSLRVLVLKNNYIEDISSLQGLECLTELDLSFNYLTEHSILWPIGRMLALQWISLEGNPLSYHPKHRLLSIKHFHPCLVDNKFVLDHWPLSKSEKMLISENHGFSVRTIQPSVSKKYIVPLSDSTNPENTFSSLESSISRDFLIKSQCSETSRNTEKNVFKSKKKTNVKEAIIAEEQDKNNLTNESRPSPSHLETSMEHLETKKQILALREKFGEVDWLSSQAGTFMQDIMGLQSTTSLYSSPITKDLVAASSISSVEKHDDLISSVNDEDIKDSNTESTISGTAENDNDNENTEQVEENTIDNETLNNELTLTLENPIDSSYDSELEKDDLYLVQKRNNSNEMEKLFLVITSDNIKERDTITGKIQYSWSMASVVSCVLGRGEETTVDIIFDTVREDRQNRRYFIELEDAKKIVSTISEKMSDHPILLKVYKCMKCSTHFSQDEEYSSIRLTSTSAVKQLKCPTCASRLVIETNELSTTYSENEKIPAHKQESIEIPGKVNLQHSESVSSIGSATSLEESRESTPSASALVKKYESDIEILSNPSQSSIEVLDEASKANLTPNRKKLSEENFTKIGPSLLTITDATPVIMGLTESSSSGSLTDSICTAYENRTTDSYLATKVGNQLYNNEKLQNDNNEKEVTSVANISTMLEGLLQSIKIGSSKSLIIKTEEESSSVISNVHYSYTDFNSVDHRVKLHIILNIFEHESEELALLLRADILMYNLKDVFPGCLILSTSKVYILRINGSEGEDPQRWLHKEYSWAIDRLRSIAPLPFKQGILIEIQQPIKLAEEYTSIHFLCILQDFQRTSNFLFYITDLPLPANCKIESSIPEHCSTSIHNLLPYIKNHQKGDVIRLLALYSSAILKYQNITTKLQYSALLVTTSVLVMLEDNIEWLLLNTKTVPVVLKEQAMSNLMGIEHYDTMLILNFLDEIAGSEETWTLQFTSTGAAEAVINSIQLPWEELFSVPMQITTKTIQDSEKS